MKKALSLLLVLLLLLSSTLALCETDVPPSLMIPSTIKVAKDGSFSISVAIDRMLEISSIYLDYEREWEGEASTLVSVDAPKGVLVIASGSGSVYLYAPDGLKAGYLCTLNFKLDRKSCTKHSNATYVWAQDCFDMKGSSAYIMCSDFGFVELN